MLFFIFPQKIFFIFPFTGQVLKPHSLFHHYRARNTLQPFPDLHRTVDRPRGKSGISA